MEKYMYLPEAEGTKDFVIIGSKSEFIGICTAALAIAAVLAIILFIRKNRK